MSEPTGQRGPVSLLHVLVSFGRADGRPVHVRSEQVRLMNEFMDRALLATGNRPDAVERFPEEDGLLCAMPVETPVDGAVESLPDSLARQLARYNERVSEAYLIKAVLSFACGPSPKAHGRLIGPARDAAVAHAKLPAILDELAGAPPGTVITVLDSVIFDGYVRPEFGQNLSPRDFTEIPAERSAWFSTTHIPARPEPTPAPPAPAPAPGLGNVRRLVALAVVITLLMAGGFLVWKLSNDGQDQRQADPGATTRTSLHTTHPAPAV